MKQQSKADWIGFGDECSKQFMEKISKGKPCNAFINLRIKMTNVLKGLIMWLTS